MITIRLYVPKNFRLQITDYKLLLIPFLLLGACSTGRRVAGEAREAIIDHADFRSAHIGISVYEPSTDTYLYDFQGDKFFVPASNTKLLTLYAAMKYLGDSLPAFRYAFSGDTLLVEGTGDPGFLHADFPQQPAFDFLRRQRLITVLDNPSSSFRPLGRGWAWDDYDADYMPERSAWPIYGNTAMFDWRDSFTVFPKVFYNHSNLSGVNQLNSMRKQNIVLARRFESNDFTASLLQSGTFKKQWLPFKTTSSAYPDQASFVAWLLSDTLRRPVTYRSILPSDKAARKIFYSTPTDSMLSVMMHRSDNFFAEQSLLMVSGIMMGAMSDRRMIDTLLKTDYSGMPQPPKWVDGSGLSRYNLVSPRDFVWLLTKMKHEFAWERITAILPTGGTGTLSSYYKNYAGRIYAKTGSLSNHLALSGYLLTKKGRTLVFSVLINAEMAPPANIRKGVEKFLTTLIEHY